MCAVLTEPETCEFLPAPNRTNSQSSCRRVDFLSRTRPSNVGVSQPISGNCDAILEVGVTTPVSCPLQFRRIQYYARNIKRSRAKPLNYRLSAYANFYLIQYVV